MHRAMRQGEIVLRAHFDKTRNGSLELERHKSSGPQVKVAGFRLGGGNKLHMPIIESVDQRDKPLGFIAPSRANDRDGIEDHGMEPPRKSEKIGGAERQPAKIAKAKRATLAQASGTCTAWPSTSRVIGAPRSFRSDAGTRR